MKTDPFGEQDTPQKYTLNIECTPKEYADLVKYMTKKGIKIG